MKKLKLLVLTLFTIFTVLVIGERKVDASSGPYYTYSYLNVTSGKLLKDYTSDELDSELDRVRHRKFSGWNIYKFNSNVRTTFIKEALFSYHNTSSTPYTYKISITSEKTIKTSCSATGSIGMNAGSTGKTFKAGLTGELKLQGEYSEIELNKEQENLEITVDPNSVVVGYIEGTGYYTNGVACSYFFWIEQELGAFEYFTITSSYLRIEKRSL